MWLKPSCREETSYPQVGRRHASLHGVVNIACVRMLEESTICKMENAKNEPFIAKLGVGATEKEP